MKNLFFAGTSEFSAIILKKLIAENFNIGAVYCQPDRPNGRGLKLNPCAVKKVAVENHLALFQPVNFKNESDSEILKENIIKTQAEILIVAAYGLILPESVLNLFPYGALNIHASLLPRWRGAAPIQRAILAGDVDTGISIMQMNAGLDTGDVLLQKSIPILNSDNAAIVHDKLSHLGADLIIQSLKNFESLRAHPQNNQNATYAQKILKNEAQINWNDSSENIHRKIRAFNPNPGAFTFYQNALFKIWQANISDEKFENKNPGEVIKISDKKFAVVCGDKNALILEEIQKAGGKKMNATPFFLNQKELFFENPR